MKNLWIPLAFGLLLSCKTSNPSSTVKHELDKAVETDAKYAWTTQPYDEMLNELDIKTEAEKRNILPETTPMAERLQFWVDRIDNELRSHDKTGMFPSIPKPKVRLLNFPEMNAFVKIAWIQFDNVKFSYSDTVPADFQPTEKAVAYFNGNYMIDTREGHPEHGDLAEIDKQLKRAYRMFPECELKLRDVGQGNILISPKTQDCNVDPQIDPKAAYTFVLPSVGSDFIVYTGLLKDLKEEEIIYVLAHELKHYYGAQVGVQGKDYFFRLTPENNGHNPVQDKSLDTLKSNFDQSFKVLVKSMQKKDYLSKGVNPALFTKIEGQKIHSYLAGSQVSRTAANDVEIRNLENFYSGREGQTRAEVAKIYLEDEGTKAAIAQCDAGKPEDVWQCKNDVQKCEKLKSESNKTRCTELTQAANNYSVLRSSLGMARGMCFTARSVLGRKNILSTIYNTGDLYALVGDLSADDRSQYLMWESAAIACLNYTTIVADKDYAPDEGHSTQKMPASTMLKNLTAMRFGTPTNNLPPVEGPLGTFLVKVSERMKLENKFDYDPENFAKAQEKWDEIKKLDNQIETLTTELAMLGEGATTNKVGFYSVEQEADEAAAEWVSRIGLDPEAGISASMQLIANAPERATCESERAAGWKDKDGQPLLLPWGNFSLDNHPESCYRARNIAMEIAAHKYPKAPEKKDLLSAADWQKLLDDLKTRTQTIDATIEQKLSFASALHKLEKNQFCSYANSRVPSP